MLAGGYVLKHILGEQVWGEDCCWLHRNKQETEMRGFMARNVPRGSLVYPENEASLLSGMQGAGLPLQHPSLTTRAPLFGHWEGCLPEGALPSCCNFLLVHATTGTSHTP